MRCHHEQAAGRWQSASWLYNADPFLTEKNIVGLKCNAPISILEKLVFVIYEFSLCSYILYFLLTF